VTLPADISLWINRDTKRVDVRALSRVITSGANPRILGFDMISAHAGKAMAKDDSKSCRIMTNIRFP
jgi:hypothetical protein